MKKKSVNAADGKIEQNALAHFSAGRYKDAADLYKYLLKREDNSFHRQQLAQCYLHRALQMAAKGMPKEAAVLWENYAEWTAPPLAALDAYILWQLAAGNTQKANARIAELTAKQLDEDYPWLAGCLGLLLISGSADFVAHLPPDSAFLLHWGVVREALAAYQNGQSPTCEQSLQKLPFRSAFRDFRTLLKAQMASSTSVEQARSLLGKIPEHSPYQTLAQVLLAYMQEGAGFVQTALALDPVLRRNIARTKELSKSQIALLEALQKLQDQVSAKAQFDLVLKQRSLFGIQDAQAFCQGMLVVYPAGIKDYLKYFEAKGGFEEYRLQALLYEQAENNYEAGFYWLRCIEILEQHRPANDKKIALILRHMADRASLEEALELIVDSLDYDGDDRDSYLKILNYYRQTQANPAEYQAWLEKGLQRFPADIDLLAQAAQSAADKKAFKKAAGYAAKLLKIDPVNSLAKQLLFANHLAHARRLIKTEKFHLVSKEIQAAEQLMVDKSLRQQAELLRGFYVWAAEDKQQGLQQIVETVQKLNDDPVNARFQIMLEAELLELPAASFMRALPVCKDHLLSAPQLTRLTALIEHYAEQVQDVKLLCDALDKIKAPIKKSIQQQALAEDLLLSWCRVLANIRHFELLRHCAKPAQAKWQKPVWMYYRIFAECNGDVQNLNLTSGFSLQYALMEAQQQNDQKTAILIGRFLDATRGLPDLYDDDAVLGDDYQTDEFSYAVVDDLFAHVPEKLMHKIGLKVQDIMMETEPDQFVNDMIRQYSKKIDAKRLLALFNNPAFMAAAACVKAAQQLQIDIGLGFEDVVYRFENDSPQISLPFF
ncbi:hypothetical protein [Methylomonas methanica]|uniref:Tetratricopeptide repeat protein n=1 Tax=Methylomonas methanica (strain DSM 25384 / MC09) TaxID=857087 RepID=G0A777_METMM|nr:hypothetical protein [Methylomonas methanica]AEF99370.1 hypothetical protein Metme_0932 [Methylomonas methanica MC09]